MSIHSIPYGPYLLNVSVYRFFHLYIAGLSWIIPGARIKCNATTRHVNAAGFEVDIAVDTKSVRHAAIVII